MPVKKSTSNLSNNKPNANITNGHPESSAFIDQDGVRNRAQLYLQGNNNLCFSGPPGTGKTTLIHQLAGDKPVYTAIGSKIQVGDLLGRLTLGKDGTCWQDGILVTSMKQGGVFYADEIDQFSPDCHRIMFSVTDSRRSVFVPANNETVVADPEFRFVSSCNLATAGIDAMPRSLLDRLTVVHVNRLGSAAEEQLLRDRYNIKQQDVKWLIKVAEVTRRIDPYNGASTRQLLAAAKSIELGIERADAAIDCIISSIAGNNINRRQSIFNAISAEGLLGDKKLLESEPRHDNVILYDDGEVWS